MECVKLVSALAECVSNFCINWSIEIFSIRVLLCVCVEHTLTHSHRPHTHTPTHTHTHTYTPTEGLLTIAPPVTVPEEATGNVIIVEINGFNLYTVNYI